MAPTRTPPSALHIVSPKYPAKAFTRKVRGSVKVRFTVEPDGHTSGIHIVSSTPSDIFDDATRKAVEQWRFKPATENGKPVATTATQQLVFSPPLKRHEVEGPPPKPKQTRASPPNEGQARAPSKKAAPANRVPSNIKPVRIVAPKYPPQAYRAKHGGSVTIQFMVGTDGRTHHLKILKAKPPRTFNYAAKQAVRQWRFKPVDKPTRVVQTINFTPP
jgi:TonB family protein